MNMSSSFLSWESSKIKHPIAMDIMDPVFFIHWYIEKHFIKICSQIGNWSLDRVAIPSEVGFNLLVIWITILYLVVILVLISRFIISFRWHSDLTKILVIKDFSLLLMWIYHIFFVIKKVFLLLFIWIVVCTPRHWVWGEEYRFKIINIPNLFWCKTSSWEKYKNIQSSLSVMRRSTILPKPKWSDSRETRLLHSGSLLHYSPKGQIHI